MSLDIKKAFPSVRLDQIPIVLKQRGVPIHLINRLVKAVFQTRISLVWFGQKTRYHQKTRGIKEGCPVSPQLFNLMIDEVVITLKEILRDSHQLHLNLFEGPGGSLRPPFLMAYADDLLLVSEELPSLEKMFEELLDLLGTLDLSINESKTKMLVRDPEGRGHPDHYQLAGKQLTRVDHMKFLGTKLLSKTDRPANLRERTCSALSIFKKLFPYLQKLRAPFSLLRVIYSTVFVPIMIFGANTMSTTQVNRRSLARKEILIIQGLASISHPRPPPTTVKVLLRGRTINRRLSAQRIRFYSHVLRRPFNSILRRALCLGVWKRRIGRPVFTFLDSLLNDFQQYSYNSQDWEAHSSDKQLIKGMTEEIYDENMPEEFDYENIAEPDIYESVPAFDDELHPAD